jgi:LysR family transcriptional regulator, transcriptional activator of nhaA
MEWLNYNHLFYFWVVAREGGLVKGSAKLLLAPQTVSAQIKQLERTLGDRLFTREGKGLALTEAGRLVLRYADEMFTLGRELRDAVRGRPSDRPLRFVVGLADVIPKLVAYRLLEPALRIGRNVQLVCREDKPEPLLAQLAAHQLDIVISDAPVGASVSVKAFNHHLGECASTVFAEPALAARLRRGFPDSLDNAPLLVPEVGCALRRAIDHWLDDRGLRPQIAGEFEDSALLKVFGQAGAGAFFAPAVIEKEVLRQYRVSKVGRVDRVREQFFAISVERRIKHPAVVAISQAAKHRLFVGDR